MIVVLLCERSLRGDRNQQLPLICCNRDRDSGLQRDYLELVGEEMYRFGNGKDIGCCDRGERIFRDNFVVD